ncbi:MAG: hypothetical protein ACFFCY_17900 [Promethearchaeota archaeon]
MKEVFRKYNKKFVGSSIIFLTLSLIFIYSPLYVDIYNNLNKIDSFGSKETFYHIQDSTNDTTAPTITFIQPAMNNTIIKTRSYIIKVNISDENPPIFGNVTFQISNITNYLFNTTMNYDGESQWSFNWNNITSYPHQVYDVYIIQILAKDSSSNENLGISGEFYIYLNVSGDSPGIWQVIIYILLVCFIIAAIVVFLNRRIIRKMSDKKTRNVKGI